MHTDPYPAITSMDVGMIRRREGQMIEVLFDADQYMSPADWTEPTPEPPRHMLTSLTVQPRTSRRDSTSSSISCASHIQLSPTLPPSPTICAWNTTRKTSPRPTSSFRPCARGLDAAALFLAGVPGAEDAVRKARDVAITQSARELKLARRLAPRSNVPQVVATIEWMSKTAEITEKMQIQKLREGINETETRMRAGRGMFRGVRKRFF